MPLCAASQLLGRLKLIGRDFIVAMEKCRTISWMENRQCFKELQRLTKFKPKPFAMRGV
jgi:hypothetical protein